MTRFKFDYPYPWLATFMIGLSLLHAFSNRLLAGDSQPVPTHRLIVGWDDAVICCGPGTDAGMDSPPAIERMVKRWKARGIQGVYWRVDEAMLPERFMTRWKPKVSPSQNYLLERVDQTLVKFPLIKTLLGAAKREGVEIWAWYPTIYSNGAPPTGPGFTQAWLYENKFGKDHPEILSVDRAGHKQYMVWEYAYPEARQAKVAEFVQFAKDYGFKRFVACLRTEAAQMQPAPKHADQFGFNAPVVAEMKTRHGIDILTDPRFDYAHPKFNVRDPMLENWRKLRGEYLTQFYRELRQALNAVDPQIEIAVQIPGDRAGTCLGNWHLDWKTWINEGLVNELVVPVVLDGYEGYGASAKPANFGYLEGAVSVETVRAFINQSRQPTARVIQAGGPATSYHNPPPNASGWRLDAWPDLWCGNMAERWEQWRGDLAEFGHIKFIEQSFDGFPEGSDGYGGGFGDFCHRPDLRSCPGYWETLGDGSNSLPHAQSKVRHGEKGRALKLTRAANGLSNLSVRHHGRHDRGSFPFPGDTAISSGTCQLDYWVYRPDGKSALVTYLGYDFDPANRFDVGVYVTEGDPGTVSFRETGKYVASEATMTVGHWHRITFRVDLDHKIYSAEITAEGQAAQMICQGVKYHSSHNAFNMLEFSPQGATGSVLFLDDVSLHWTPGVLPRPPGRQILVQAGFESLKPGQPLVTGKPRSAEGWTIREGQMADIRVDNDISYGREFQSLRFRGSGGRAQLTSSPIKPRADDVLTLDLDIFLKSDSLHVQMLPSVETVSSDEVGFALRNAGDDSAWFEIRTRAGTWHCGIGGNLVDTKFPAAFDAWNHLQLVLDGKTKTCRVTLQVIGEAPRDLYRGVFNHASGKTALLVELACARKTARPDGPAFDNLRITRQSAAKDP